MAVTVRQIMQNATFQRAAPTVLTGETGLDRAVRWAFASDRADVATFLAGGELLLVDGQALCTADSGAMARYAASLAAVGVAALAVEWTGHDGQLPVALASAARQTGLPLIMLGARVPFVELSQCVNTALVRDQMQLRMRVDDLSSTLREALAHVQDVDALAAVLARQLGEGIALFDADGLLVARAGRRFDDGVRTVVIPLADGMRPLGAVEVTQSGMALPAETLQTIETAVAPVAALTMDPGARAGMAACLTAGPANGVHATADEAQRTHGALEALGCEASSVCMAFALRCRSLVASADLVTRIIDRFESHEGCMVVGMLRGEVMIGCFTCQDASCGTRRFGQWCLDALRLVEGGDLIEAVHGRVAPDAAALTDDFGAVHDVLREEPAYGTVTGITDAALARLTAEPGAGEAIDGFVLRILGAETVQDEQTLDTLCACFDALGNKSDACAALGVQRQTLYNRLDKASQLIGLDPDDHQAWAAVLCAAKLATVRARQTGQAVHCRP